MPSGSRGPEPCWGITWSRGGPSGPGPLALAASLGAAPPATPSHPGSRTRPRPLANRLTRKLSASLVSSAAGSVVCRRAARCGGCGAATGGRSSTWVRVRPWGPVAAALVSSGGRSPRALLRSFLSKQQAASLRK